MLRIYCTILFIALLTSCQRNMYKSIDNELSRLTNNTDKRKYLENLFSEDQAIRNGQLDSIAELHTINSKEWMAFYKHSNEVDSIHLIKIERYLNKFGYPSRTELGDIANCTPWVIIHHSNGVNERRRNFNNLYSAYVKGELKRLDFLGYLERLYWYEHDSHCQNIEGKSEIDKIEILIQILQLKKEVKKS